MTDIVERLRQVQGDNDDAREAADEIERLRAALSEETAIHRQTDDALAKAEAEIERLRANEKAAIFSFRETNDMALAEIERLRAEIAQCDRIINMSD